jgi:hypothetical protein
MTREEQLLFCKQCLNRKMDVSHGLVCSLTGQMATFQDECPDFQRDEAVHIAPIDDKEGLEQSEIRQKLSPQIIERLRMEQNLLSGGISGVIVGVIGAILWGVITVITGFQIGYMAIGIGAIVGLAIRHFGNGIDPIFGFWGAVVSLFSVLLGNFFSIIGFIAHDQELGYFETLLGFDYSLLGTVMGLTFSIMDLVFYGIALYAGYKFSFRVITEKDLMELKKMNR